ncbi:MAG TPA: hypothetical protein VNQ90_07815 [Chthoniobacteraceae bacterium]|nr:hypothetical protein [Chthoniobacteraceae bacterium]
MPKGTDAGHSLVEILIAVGLVAILLVFLSAGYGRAMEHSRAIRCMGNLRQLGVAFSRSVSEHQGKLPVVIKVQQELAGYLLPGEKFPAATSPRKTFGVMICPEDQAAFFPEGRSYAVNHYMGPTTVMTSQHVSRMLEVVHPGRVAYLMDGFREGMEAGANARFNQNTSPFGKTTQMGGVFRHRQRANVLFADGRVEALSHAEFLQDMNSRIFPKNSQ